MNKQLKIVEKSKIFFIISAIIIVVGIVLMIVPGLNLGLDFTEGASVTVNINVIPGEADRTYAEGIEDYIESEGFEVGSYRISTTSDGMLSLIFNLSYSFEGGTLESGDFANRLVDQTTGEGLIEDLRNYINEDTELFPEHTEELVAEGEKGITHSITSPDATRSLTGKAIIAIAIAIVCMLIYIGIRFRFTSGLAAVIVLIHDVLVMITLTAIFRITVNITFIAAIITVIGYSINATIIVFDRIKDNLVKYEGKGLTDADIANISIKETLRRTLLTTATTLIMIVLIAILGVSSIREFALPIIFGLLSGLYSAIVLSSCVWVQVRKLSKKIFKEKKKGYKRFAKEKKSASAEA